MIAHQKIDQSRLLYGLKSPAEKVGLNRHFSSQLSLTAHELLV